MCTIPYYVSKLANPMSTQSFSIRMWTVLKAQKDLLLVDQLYFQIMQARIMKLVFKIINLGVAPTVFLGVRHDGR